MIVGCPNCSARFVVKAQAIGEEGRKVKCARCKHTWFQKPDMEVLEAAKKANLADAPNEMEPVPEGANVPAITKEGASWLLKIAAMISFVFFALTVSLVSANKILPNLSPYYELFGIYDTVDITLYDVKVEKISAGKYQDVLVSGKIVNDSDTEKKLPDLRMTILSEEGKKLKTVMLEFENSFIAPGEKVDFDDRIPQLPNNASKVVMDLGNSLDLASR